MVPLFYGALLLLPEGLKLPGQIEYEQPDSATNVPYLELLESNTHIIYPALAIFVVVLIVAGILHAWKTDDLDSVVKAQAKREIVMQLRREMHGMSAERLTRLTGLDLNKLVRLLQEMQD